MGVFQGERANRFGVCLAALALNAETITNNIRSSRKIIIQRHGCGDVAYVFNHVKTVVKSSADGTAHQKRDS